jgi:hypothetical protein
MHIIHEAKPSCYIIAYNVLLTNFLGDNLHVHITCGIQEITICGHCPRIDRMAKVWKLHFWWQTSYVYNDRDRDLIEKYV